MQKMRAAAEARFAGQSRFHSFNSTAEATSLPDSSVDIVTADRRSLVRYDEREPSSRASCVRMASWRCSGTTPDGQHAVSEAYEALLIEFATDYEQIKHTNIDTAVLGTFFDDHL